MMPAPDREAIANALDRDGFALLPGLLDAVTCNGLIADYNDDAR